MDGGAAPRRLLVDGMNVIGSRPDGWWRDRRGAMRALVDRLRRHTEATGDTVTVVFDGRSFGLPDPGGGLTVLFSERTGRDAADDRIAELVALDEDPSGLEVVTSDRALAERVRAKGAGVVGARSFTRRLDAVAEPRPGPSD